MCHIVKDMERRAESVLAEARSRLILPDQFESGNRQVQIIGTPSLTLNSMPRVLCKCRSHCTAYNPATNKYEGLGHQVSKSTAAAHRQDDQRLVVHLALTASVANHILDHKDIQIPSHTPPLPDPLYFIEEEIAGVTNRLNTSQPLVFLNNPSLQSFNIPNAASFRHPNSGVYALKPDHRLNRDFLENENHFCGIIERLEGLIQTETVESLTDRVYRELARMWRHKEQEWLRQGNNHQGTITVNTGQ